MCAKGEILSAKLGILSETIEQTIEKEGDKNISKYERMARIFYE
ncbi:MAG: hypothetical protein ABSC77_03325 [Terracidiphilus sp.]